MAALRLFPGGRNDPDGSKLQKEHVMASNVYVGNLTFNTTSADLQTLFSEHGEVKKAQVITDRETGRSRGFGFVEMATTESAEAAISSLNGREIDGRALTVNLAKERAR
jgi:RNA recognition motif-containing protein